MADPAVQAAAAPKPVRPFKRGLLSLNFKFSSITGALLLMLLFMVALVVNDDLRTGLTREVGERARAVARNLATKIVSPILAPTGLDDLTLIQMMKDSLEESPAAPQAPEGLLARAISDLKASLNPASEIKNEGIQQVIITIFPRADVQAAPAPADAAAALSATAQPQYYRYDAASGGDQDHTTRPYPAVHPADPTNHQPFPFGVVDDRPVYEFLEPVTATDASTGAIKILGEVRLYLRQDVIADAVRMATTRLAAVMLLSLLAGLFFLWLVVRTLFNPIRHLVRGVNAVASGDFGVQLAIKRKDELGDLVDAYNGMAKTLAEKEAVQDALTRYTSKDLVNQMLTEKVKLDLGGQKVHATVLFSVVRGMHALSQTVPAEEYVALINEYLEAETEPIMRNQGSIDKFIGDEVMAVWLLPRDSAPKDRAEAAFKAVKAALELQQAIEKLNADRLKRGDQPFLVSVGINNGEVVSGNMGSSAKMDHTVLGGTVNLAARLGLIAAKGGQTIISESVKELVEGRFRIDTLAPVQLKGIKEPVPLFWPRQALAPGI